MMFNKRSNNKKTYWFLIIFLSLFFAILYNFPSFTDKYVIADDATQITFWMHKFKDPGLFKDDIITEMAENSFGRLGFAFPYHLLNFYLDHVTTFKILQIIIIIISSIFFYLIGKKLKNNITGTALAISFIILSPLFRNFYAYPKGFGMLYMIIFYYFFISRKYILSSLFILLQSLTYPPTCLISILIHSFHFIGFKDKRVFLELKNNGFVSLFISSLLCFIILFGQSLSAKEVLGSSYTYNEMKQLPEFYDGGRSAILPINNIFRTIIAKTSVLGVPELVIPDLKYNQLLIFSVIVRIISLIGFLGLSLIILRQKIFKVKKEIWYFLFSGIIMFYAAKFLAFLLYIPERYIASTLPLFLLLFSSVLFGNIVEKLRVKKYKSFLFIIFILAITIGFVPQMIIRGHLNSDSAGCNEYKDLYIFLSNLDKDVLVADHPRTSDCTLFYSKRKVFISEELTFPFYKKYYEQMKKRTFDYFDMYYSNSKDTVLNFCTDNNIDFIVIYNEHFSKKYLDNNNFYFNPFNDYINGIIKANDKLILNELDNFDVVYSSPDVAVIKC